MAQRRGQFQQLLKTQVVILILNFTRIHCDYLLIIYREKLLNCWSRRTFSYFSKFVCKFLSFDHFLKTFSHHSVLSFVFSFSLLSFNSSIYFLVNYLETRRHCYRKTTSRLKKLLLGNLRTNGERVILPSSRSKIKKKILSSSTNQHSVILPFMSLIYFKESENKGKKGNHVLRSNDNFSLQEKRYCETLMIDVQFFYC